MKDYSAPGIDKDTFAGLALHDDLYQRVARWMGLPDERERLLGPDRGE